MKKFLVNSIRQNLFQGTTRETEWKIIALEDGQSNILGTFTGQFCVPILEVKFHRKYFQPDFCL